MTRSLLEQKVLKIVKKEKDVAMPFSYASKTMPTLTQEQAQAIQTIQSSQDSIFLLHGVTGSGKRKSFYA